MFGGPSSTKDNTPATNDDNGDGLPVCEEVTGASDHEERGGAVASGTGPAVHAGPEARGLLDAVSSLALPPGRDVGGAGGGWLQVAGPCLHA